MSGILRKVGKVFKKIVSSRIFKVVAIAAAVYFTAGIAAGAMGSAFAVGLPGIQAAAGAIGMGSVGAFGTAAAAASSVGLAAVMGSEAMITGSAALMGAEGAGITGSIGTGLKALSAANTVTGLVGGKAEDAPEDTGGNYNGGVKMTSKSGATPEIKNGGTTDKLLKYFDANPTVTKAALTFGSDALKTGVGLYAAKSQQDSADERAAQDRVDRNRREAAPILKNPAASTYNKSLVNSVVNEQVQP